jgi:hypothetical protein
MGSAKITFNTGVAQGSVLSPLLFSLFINGLSLYVIDIGRKKRIHHGLPGTHPFNHILFTDDMTLLTPDREDMQTLLNTIQVKWCFATLSSTHRRQYITFTFIVSSSVHCGIGSEKGFCPFENIRR